MKWLSAINEKVQENKKIALNTDYTEHYSSSRRESKESVVANSEADDASVRDSSKSSNFKLAKMFGKSAVSQGAPKGFPSNGEDIAPNSRHKNMPIKNLTVNNGVSALVDNRSVDSSEDLWSISKIGRLKIKVRDHTWILKFPHQDLSNGYFHAIREVAWQKISSNCARYSDLRAAFGNVKVSQDLLLYFIDEDKDKIELSNEVDLLLCFEECHGKSSVTFILDHRPKT